MARSRIRCDTRSLRLAQEKARPRFGLLRVDCRKQILKAPFKLPFEQLNTQFGLCRCFTCGDSCQCSLGNRKRLNPSEESVVRSELDSAANYSTSTE